jgi:fatty-acyl-CoA synthase
MMTRHFEFWPEKIPKSLTIPETNLYDNLAVTARRYPSKAAIYYYGKRLNYSQFAQEAEALAGFLQQVGVSEGDRVILYMQNSPQFMIAFYAILRANAVVVPINPMNVTDELAFYIEDCEAKAAIVGQEIYDRIAPLNGKSLQHVIVAAYSDYAASSADYEIPDVVAAPRQEITDANVTLWQRALEQNLQPGPLTAGSNDMALLPYTSGTTGKPKGCMHTHRTVQATLKGASVWSTVTSETVILTTLPLFHVTGLQHSMNSPIYKGSTMVVMTRWNRDVAGKLIEQHGCSHWRNISTMMVDFLSNPKLSQYDLSSLDSIGGGGAPLPEAIGERLSEITGLRYGEGYGLTETISQTHSNPPDRSKLQCLGIPHFDVDARIINPDTNVELGPGEEGELIIHGHQVFHGYWKRPDENEKAFITVDNKTFFRTGDIAKYDEEGYFFMVDRVKRMINASGFKVWPTEVEATLYKHPAVEQACVIGAPDSRRGETVKAFVILKESHRGQVTEQDIIEWSKEKMSAYKYPRMVQFVDSLPVSGTGKILWRQLQEEEMKKTQSS